MIASLFNLAGPDLIVLMVLIVFFGVPIVVAWGLCKFLKFIRRK